MANPPFNIPEFTVYGEAIESFGLEVRGAISPVGLVMNGLIWECANIYSFFPAITTGWSGSLANVTTNWSAVGASIVTTWTPVFDGEC